MAMSDASLSKETVKSEVDSILAHGTTMWKTYTHVTNFIYNQCENNPTISLSHIGWSITP